MHERRDLKATKVHPALTRSLLLVGVERRAMIPLCGVAAMLVLLFAPNFVTPSIAAFILFILVPTLRRINKRDPQWVEVLAEHVTVAGFYHAQGLPHERRLARGTF
jgi:type IV secretory pathway TrbD component